MRLGRGSRVRGSQTLIEKGLVYSPERGLVAFTVPHFGDFMRRKHPTSC